MKDESIEDLEVVAAPPTEFEAQTIVAALRGAGIDAEARGPVEIEAGLPGARCTTRVPVLVRREELEQARSALEEIRQSASTESWDDLDVGPRADDLPLTTRHGMPPLARVAFLAALLVVLVTAVLLVVALLVGD
jgi:hypothetical protein